MTARTMSRTDTALTKRSPKRAALALAVLLAVASVFTVAEPSPDSAAASETRTRAEITRWYLYALGRSPDAGGHNFWTDYSQEIGAPTFAAAAYNIHLSQEFYNRHSNWQSRVTALYQSVLARSPDANGLNFWVGELSSGNRTWAQVVSGFAYSDEAMDRFHAINAQDCGVQAVLPSGQLYDQHVSSMTGEAVHRRRAEADNRFGIVVMNAWIRGTQRQAATGPSWVVNGPTQFKIETAPDSDRGATRTFSPNDSRATLILDHATGGAFISVHSTHFILNIRWAPDFNTTTSAFSVSALWNSVSPNWYSTGSPRYSQSSSVHLNRSRGRIHITAAPPGSSWNAWLADLATPSVDAQFWISPNSGTSFGSTWFQGDDFPNFAVYRYIACTGQWQKAKDQRHVRTSTAFWGMWHRNSWTYNQFYGHTGRTWGSPDYRNYL